MAGLAAVSSFYQYLMLSEQLSGSENPIQQTDDPARARVAERHRPALGRASRQRRIRRLVRVRTVQRVPRPLSEEQVSQLLGALHRWRDRAMLLLMPQGGLRPGGGTRRMICPVSHAARPYLCYLAGRGYLRFDWEWLIAVRSLDLRGRLGPRVDEALDQLAEEAIGLGYSRSYVRDHLGLVVGRILLHTLD